MSPQSYLARLTTFGLLFALLAVLFNWLVDPYAIFEVKRLPGFNQNKIDINNFTALSKKYQAQSGTYNALIVGNSRVELGLNPSHQCFTEAGLQPYNVGLPGAGIRTQLQYALNIMYQQPIQRVYLSLDFSDFLSRSKQPSTAVVPLMRVEENELAYLPSGDTNPAQLGVNAEDYYKSLFSLGSLLSSVVTIAGQGRSGTDRELSGFNPARDFADAVRVEGPKALFDQKIYNLEEKFSQTWYLADRNSPFDQSYADLAAFLTISAAMGVEVVLFTNPFHESYWALLQRHNLMPLYDRWLTDIEKLARASSADMGPVPLWNFSEDSIYIHEPVPAKPEKNTPLAWFWEPAHYREELGNLMVNAMLAEDCSVAHGFGRKVVP